MVKVMELAAEYFSDHLDWFFFHAHLKKKALTTRTKIWKTVLRISPAHAVQTLNSKLTIAAAVTYRSAV
jgi:hypothetical protein